MNSLRRNKYIEEILNNSHKIWNETIPSLTLNQIEWRLENSNMALGIVGYSGHIFKRIVRMILLKKENGGYVVFTPASKKDKGVPHYLFDIADIEEFVRRYPVQPVYTEDDGIPMEDLLDELEGIKEGSPLGFIETRNDKKTEVFNIIF